MKITALIARLLLGLVFIAAGAFGLFGTQPPMPGSVGQFNAVAYGTHFMAFVSAAQLVIGILLLIFVVGMRIFVNRAPTGFAFLASVIAIFSGAQLFALGIIGEYLARLHFRTMERPTYAVRTRVEGKGLP